MAASITFDFISRGGPALAADFKRTGDTAAAAARGAKVLTDVIKDLGQKEDRTAAESKTLATALRLTGDAEDRAAAKALAADIAIRRLDDSLKDSGKNAGGARGGFLGLAGEVTGLGAASAAASGESSLFQRALAGLSLATGILEPAVAALTVTVGAVAAGAAAAGIGLGGFMAVAKSQITPVTKAIQDQAAAMKGGAAAQKTYQADLKALSPVQRELMTSMTGVQTEFKTWSDSLAKPVLTPLIAAMKLVDPLLKDMSPFVRAAAGAMGILVGKLSAAVHGTGFQEWLATMLPLVKPAIVDIGTAIGNIVVGIGGMLKAFAPFVTEVLGGVDKLTRKFAGWGTTLSAHSGFNAMIAEFQQNWPLVRTGLGELATIVKNILSDMAGLATGSNSKALWEVANPLLALVAGLSSHPAVVRDLLYVLAAIQLAKKAGGVVSLGVKVAGAGQKLLDFFKTGTWTVGAAGMQTAGDTMLTAAGAMQKAADTMIGADAAAGKGGAAAGAAGAAGKGAAGGGAAAGLGAAAGVALAGALAGAAIRALGDALSPKGTFAGRLNNMFAQLGIGSLHSFTFGGVEAWVTAKFGIPVGKAIDTSLKFIQNTWNTVWANTVTGAVQDWRRVAAAWDVLMNDLAKSFDIFKNLVGIAWDDIQLTFFHGVQYILNIMGKLPGPLGAPFRTAARDIGNSMAGITADVARRTGQIQADLNSIHGPPVIKVITEASGSGQISITGSGWALGQGNIRFHAARGAFIDRGTGPTADDVLVRASKGELIVPAHLVRAGAADNLRGLIPGFAAGGFPGNLGAMPAAAGAVAGGDAGQAVRAGVAKAMAAAHAAVAAKAKAQAFNPFKGITGVPSGGPIGAGAAAAQAFAKSILWAYGWGQDQFPPLQALWNGESGWRWNALNPGSGAYGIPQSLPASKMASAGADWRTNPATQIRWGLSYIKSNPNYGSPARTYSLWLSRNPHWYAEGGLVPGYATGGSVAGPASAYLKAWQDKRGGGFGAAWGPVVVNQQIAAMAAAQRNAQTLSRASGLTAVQRRHYTAAAVDEGKRLAVLNRELGLERTWRGQLGTSDTTLARDIAAAGNAPALAKNAAGWKAQMSRQKATIAGISKMLGYSDAQQAAIAKANPPAKPPVPTGVQATHTYGGDVANTIGAFLASVAAPFGAARGGLVMDSGGWLKPGFNPVWNKTGRPEHLVPSRGGGGDVHLHLTVNAPVGSQSQLEDWFIRTANKAAQHGRLSQAVKTAAR